MLLISLLQNATLIRGFIMIRLLMHIVAVLKEGQIYLTLILQFVILSPPLYKSSHLPMSLLATK
jgi:hypothetical protein